MVVNVLQRHTVHGLEMPVTKRKTTKIGPYTRRTVTQSSKGTRITISSKPPGAATRRTSSTNLKTGKNRVTHTTKLGGGWFKTNSKTFTPVRKARTSRSRSSGGGGDFSFTDLLLLPFLPFIMMYDLIVFCIRLLFSPWFWITMFVLLLLLS